MLKTRSLTVIMLMILLITGAFSTQAQDGTCTIDLTSAQLALDDAQQLADSGDHFGATQIITDVQKYWARWSMRVPKACIRTGSNISGKINR
ncbi:MAG: hypothetical protein H6672_21955 [Anaerolineaceae bacterium]|nr:hypothetical protein [Anaerolineaceae bacterium]